MFKILIAEDDKELRLLFQRVLTRSGYAVQAPATVRKPLPCLTRITLT